MIRSLTSISTVLEVIEAEFFCFYTVDVKAPNKSAFTDTQSALQSVNSTRNPPNRARCSENVHISLCCFNIRQAKCTQLSAQSGPDIELQSFQTDIHLISAAGLSLEGQRLCNMRFFRVG